jgi:hypothetical protein
VSHPFCTAAVPLAASLLACAAGCGGSTHSSPPISDQLQLSSATPPPASGCGFDQIRASAAPARGRTAGAPAAGVYRYATSGTLSLAAQNRGASRLPATTEALATPVSRAGALECFGTEHRFGSGTSTVDVYLRRGGDVYAVALGFDTPNDVETVLPRPAILALSATATRWTGVFGGPTSGSYQFEILGRRAFRVGGRIVEAVGVSSSASYRGEVTGSRRATTWLSTDGSLIVAESGVITVDIGVAVDRLAYSLRLLSPAAVAGAG